MGKLIVLEGLDGCGKSTQLELLTNKLEESNFDFKKIKLPDYESQSSTLVKMYLDGELGDNPMELNPYAVSSFYACDRYINYNLKWRSDYESGKLIVADRYTTSNAIYQATKFDDDDREKFLEFLFDYEYEKIKLPKPDLVIFLDMPTEISQRLMSERYQGDENKKDLHEIDVKFLNDCRKNALFVAKKYQWKVLNCYKNSDPLPIETIEKEIWNEVKQIIYK